MAKRRKVTKENAFTVVRQIGRDNSDVDANGNSKIHFVRKLIDSEFYHTMI